MKPLLKKVLAVGAPALAIPAYIVFAQTAPSPTPSSSSVPFIPLFVNGTTSGTTTGGTGGTTGGANSWFIDVAKNSIVQCSQAAASGGGTAGAGEALNCTSTPIPTATPAPTPAPAPAPAP
jgi:hypothetical protein